MAESSMESLCPKVMDHMDIQKGSLGTALDSLSLDINSPHIQVLGEVPEGHLFILSPELRKVMVESSMESLGPQVVGHRDIQKGSPGTALDSLSLDIRGPRILVLGEVPEGHLFILSPGHPERQSRDSTRQPQSGQQRPSHSGSVRSPRGSPVHPESSEDEEHSVVSRGHSGSTQGHGGVQHGESGSPGHGPQGHPERQSRDSSRQPQSGHQRPSHSDSGRSPRGSPVHPDSSEGEQHSVVSHRHSESSHTQGGVHHGQPGSPGHGPQGHPERQSRDSTRQPQSGHQQPSHSGSGRSSRGSPVHPESSEGEQHSVVSRGHSGSTQGYGGSQHGQPGSPGHVPQGHPERQSRDSTRQPQSGHQRPSHSGSGRSPRGSPVHSESSEGEQHSVVSRGHSGSTKGYGGVQHGESGSPGHVPQGHPERQSRDSTRQHQSGQQRPSHSGSARSPRGSPVHSESSEDEEHSVVSRGHSRSTQGHGGVQHGEPVSPGHGPQGHPERQSRDSTRQHQSGHQQPSHSGSGRSPRGSPVHPESSEGEQHSVVSRRYSQSSQGHIGVQHGDSGSPAHGRQVSPQRHSGTESFRSSSSRHQYDSSHHWRHGSYGCEEYDYGQSGYGPSGGSRTSSRKSSPLRSSHRGSSTQVSTYGQSLSLSHHAGFKGNEGMGGLVLKYRDSDTSHGHSLDHYNLTDYDTTGNVVSNHPQSLITLEHSNDYDTKYGYSINGKQETTLSEPIDQSGFSHSQYTSFQEHSESNSIGNQTGFGTNKRQVYNHGQSSDSYQLSSDSRYANPRSSPSNSLQSLYYMGTEECKYLPSVTTFGEGRLGQEPGYNPSGTIRKYSQYVDDKETRDSEFRGYHEKRDMNLGSAFVDSNTPLYTYVQEQRYHYFY
ncbi:uncharacterized protein LOC143274033 [Peromyscus maniculatus bairdii]|uniref:uncharacterized protein LOC143274033 n=1 Tax=Peromyscus maniculatus bairdii TaxID=230844 RepID=UPI003FD4F1CD